MRKSGFRSKRKELDPGCKSRFSNKKEAPYRVVDFLGKNKDMYTGRPDAKGL